MIDVMPYGMCPFPHTGSIMPYVSSHGCLCRCDTAVASWPRCNRRHAAKTVVIRLPREQAYTLANTMLEHPEVALLLPAQQTNTKAERTDAS